MSNSNIVKFISIIFFIYKRVLIYGMYFVLFCMNFIIYYVKYNVEGIVFVEKG